MKATFLYALRCLRGQLIGWSLGLFLYLSLTMTSYSIFDNLGDDFDQLIEKYPPEMSAFFGDMTKILQPAGFLQTYMFSSMPLILGIFLVIAGTGTFAPDEESGRLDLLMTYPVPRTHMFAARLLALLTATTTIILFMILGVMLGKSFTSLEIGILEILPAFLGLLTLSFVFACGAVLLAFLLPSRRSAGMIGGFWILASYLIPPLAKINETLEPIAVFSPNHHFQGAEAIHSFDPIPPIAFLAVSLVFATISCWLFTRRDIRVAGEGSFRIRVSRSVS